MSRFRDKKRSWWLRSFRCHFHSRLPLFVNRVSFFAGVDWMTREVCAESLPLKLSFVCRTKRKRLTKDSRMSSLERGQRRRQHRKFHFLFDEFYNFCFAAFITFLSLNSSSLATQEREAKTGRHNSTLNESRKMQNSWMERNKKR